jgi:hypothetical protein
VANLGLSESQILLVQIMAGMSRISIAPEGPETFSTLPVHYIDSLMEPPGHDKWWLYTRNQRLLTSLRESIVDKPPYISGTLQLPDFFLSLFYKIAKDGHAARFGDGSP